MKKEIAFLINKIERHGYVYALLEYSDWKELESVDPVLYNHIVAYCGAAYALNSYLNKLHDQEKA